MAAHREVTLVCGGGGVWGVAWMTGLAMGLVERGLDLREAAAFVGTSAGSVVSTHLAGGFAVDGLFERQTVAAKQPRERAPTNDNLAVMGGLMRASWTSERERLAAICDLARKAQTITVAERRGDIVDRLGFSERAWPQKRLSLTAVDMETLDLVVFDADSGVSLVDAVSASCAVPGVWPPTPIGGRLYVDGGVWRTAENAHLAEGAKTVLILSPVGGSGLGGTGLGADVERLQAQGSEVMVIAADEASLRTMAPGPLNPETRQPAAEAGRAQAAREAAKALALFGLG